MRKSFLLPLLTILIVLSCIAAYIYKTNFDVRKQAEMQQISQEYNSVLKQLRTEKQQLSDDIEVLKKEAIVEDMGSTIILITDTNSKCLEDIVPKLDDCGFHGVIAIDDEYSPIDEVEGYLNKEDLDYLVSKGYELVLSANSNTNVIDLYNKYIDAGYDIKGYYFPNADINQNQLTNIKELGIETILLYGEEYNDDETLIIKTVGSFYQNVKTDFENSVTTSKTLAISVGHSRSIEMYDDENIKAMLKVIKGYTDTNSNVITNLTEAKQRYDAYLDYLIGSSQEEKIKKIEELEIELSNIEEKLATYVIE